MQNFICSSHSVISRPLGRRAGALPIWIAVPYFVAPLPHGALLGALWSRLDGATHHLRRHVLLSIGARGSRDPVSAKLEWELVLWPSGRSAVSSRVCTPILVIQVLLGRRLRSLLLARLLGLCWRQLLLRLPLPGAVRDVVHLPFVPLGGRAVAAIHRSLVVLDGKRKGIDNMRLSGQKRATRTRWVAMLGARGPASQHRLYEGKTCLVASQPYPLRVGSVFQFYKPRPIPCGWLRSFLVGSTRMPQGQKSAHRKDFPVEKTGLHHTLTTNHTVYRYLYPFKSRNFIRPLVS